MGEIKRHFTTKAESSTCPSSFAGAVVKINQVTDDLTKELPRSPSIIAQRLDTNVEEILEAMGLQRAALFLLREAALVLMATRPANRDQYVTEDEDLAGSDDRIVLEGVRRDFSPRAEIIRMRLLRSYSGKGAEKLNIPQVQVFQGCFVAP